jgi:hypothetical protein
VKGFAKTLLKYSMKSAILSRSSSIDGENELRSGDLALTKGETMGDGVQTRHEFRWQVQGREGLGACLTGLCSLTFSFFKSIMDNLLKNITS